MTKADRSFQVIKTGSLWLVVAGFDASQTRLETMGGPKDRLRNVYGGGGVAGVTRQTVHYPLAPLSAAQTSLGSVALG